MKYINLINRIVERIVVPATIPWEYRLQVLKCRVIQALRRRCVKLQRALVAWRTWLKHVRNACQPTPRTFRIDRSGILIASH